jgi:hypothetical protein
VLISYRPFAQSSTMDDATDDTFMPVIGPGVKLSMALYYFASPLGSVGEDMKDLGAEVTLFCAIMRQVRAVFVKPKPFRISTTAIDDVHDVLRRGKAIFAKIRALLDRLQNERSTIDVYTRVKHTFSKSKVLMWKESLRSCNAMVQVMLTTMAFAECIATSTGSVIFSLLLQELILSTGRPPRLQKTISCVI